MDLFIPRTLRLHAGILDNSDSPPAEANNCAAMAGPTSAQLCRYLRCCVHLSPSSDNKRSEKSFAEMWGHLGEKGAVSLEQSKSETQHQHQRCAGAGCGSMSCITTKCSWLPSPSPITIANEAIFTLTCPSPADGSSSGSTSDR